jgi:hypothetical protein
MHRLAAVTGWSVALMLWSAPAFGQATPACDPQGRVITPQQVEGQVVRVDPAHSKVSVRAADGTVHEFQASKETLQDLKVGDRINANLRQAPKCP